MVEGKGIKNTHAQTKHKSKRFGETVSLTPDTWTSPYGVIHDCDCTFCYMNPGSYRVLF